MFAAIFALSVATAAHSDAVSHPPVTAPPSVTALHTLGDSTDLRVERVRPWRGHTRVHLARFHEGVRVLGEGAVVDFRPDGAVDWTATHLGGAVTADTTPTVSLERASAGLQPQSAELVVLPDATGGALAWLLHLRHGAPRRVLVDAHSGRVLRALPDALHAWGLVYTTFPDEEHLLEVELTDRGEAAPGEGLDGAHVSAVSVGFDGDEPTEVQNALADEEGDYLYPPDPFSAEDGFAEVHASWHAAATRQWFADTFAHPVPGQVDVTVNYRESPDSGYDNAWFAYGMGGRYTLTFGQGADTDWSYHPGVVIHEFSHGIVEDVVGMFDAMTYPFNMDEYGLHPAPGGLTEGLPDYWAVTRLDSSVQGTWGDGTPIRDLDNDATCPGSIFGEAHNDSEVIGGALWELREELGADVTDPLVYGAMGLLSPSPTYAEFADALLTQARELDGAPADTLDVIQRVMDERGLSTCGRDVPLGPDAPATGLFAGVDLFDESLCELVRGAGIAITSPFQYTVTVPEGGLQALDFELTLTPLRGEAEEGDLQYSVAIARDGLVHYEIEELELLGYVFPIPSQADNAVATWQDNPTHFRVDATELGLHALPAHSTWTLSVLGMNCKTATIDVSVAAVPLDPPARGAAKGCGSKAPVGMALLLPGLLGLRRRRRG